MKISGLIPMRHSSERVVDKNYRDFAGKPLFHYIVHALQSCKSITTICIDTDSEVIMESVNETFPDVIVLLRPKHLRDGETPMNDVLENTINQVESDLYLQTHSTNPLLQGETIQRAIDTLVENPGHDSLFGVTRLQTRLYDKDGVAINHDPAVLLRTQDLPPVYEENSNIYLFTQDSFMKNRNRIGQNPIMFEIDSIEASDIDVEDDFTIAELLFKKREGIV